MEEYNMFFEKEKKINKYVIMSKFKGSSNFFIEEQFDNLASADTYVKLMIDNEKNNRLEYFLFEQSKDYNYAETTQSI